MLIRLRSSTLGILGLVAAVGLGLIAFASLQGWPGVFSGPLPQEPGPGFLRNDPIVAPAGETASNPATPQLAPHPASGDRRSRGTRPGGASALTAAEQVDAGSSQPQPAPAPQPSPSSPGSATDDVQPAPESTTPTAESAPANARPTTSGGESTPVAAGSDESSGQSTERHGKHHGWSQPAWSESGKQVDSPPGHSSWGEDQGNDRDHEDHGGGKWGHGGHDGGWGHH